MSSLDILLLNQLTWNWPLLIAVTCISSVYLHFVHRFAKAEITRLQPISFFTGFGLLVLVIGSPFATISHLSFSLHMMQMSILYFIIPPLILLGIPEQLVGTLPRLKRPRWFNIPRIPPNMSLYTFAGLFFLYHTPIILSTLVSIPALKYSYLLILFTLSFGMWHPIASPVPLLRRCTCKLKRYAFISGVAITPACLLFIGTAILGFTSNPLLLQLVAHLCGPSFTEAFPIELPWPFNTRYDQILSGFLMMGIHKFSLVMALRLERKVSSRFYEELEREIGRCK
ncbi:cytochrome c oxidase assembly protein [Sporosarcina highlanderae]|uniref:Cytochrome c oxidase assembly protein n=1 Tax=Sporosarcina highlanderae TaxID=3035916 RepID=A0ABT8JTD7_9BACL|nr:cytochrome c oxidase assembly protein [Sporosarcina highlanderae]MDN4608441.1 cytochrome c oxidase assembly protein [Sporosarcina highlanderae]